MNDEILPWQFKHHVNNVYNHLLYITSVSPVEGPEIHLTMLFLTLVELELMWQILHRCVLPSIVRVCVFLATVRRDRSSSGEEHGEVLG